MTLKKEMHDCAIVILATILDSTEGTREYDSIDAHPGIILGCSYLLQLITERICERFWENQPKRKNE